VSALADINVHGIASALPSVLVLACTIIPQTCIGQFRKINRIGANLEFMIGEQLDAKLKGVTGKFVSGLARVLYTRIIVA